jgi:hypothetical protein
MLEHTADNGPFVYVFHILETRARLINSLKSIYRKRADRPKRKHGNIPV